MNPPLKQRTPFLLILTTLFFAAVCHAQEPVAGIGVQVAMVDEKLTVMRVLPKTPASEAGLTAGQVIVMVDGVLTPGKSIEECIAKIRGLPGTKVRLEIIDPKSGIGFARELTRRVIQ